MASTYEVIRGGVSGLHESDDFIDLGTVSCIPQAPSSTGTRGSEDAEVPSLGEAFFYLVSRDDGRDSGYG